MNTKPPALALLALLLAGLLGACSTDKELPDPARFIPPDSEYHNTELGFRFRYPNMLRLDVDDRDYDGIDVRLLYPGSHAEVFVLRVRPAADEESVLSKAIPGSVEPARVAGLAAQVFDTAADAGGQTKRKTLFKNDGWLYVFEGSSESFADVRDSFRFDALQ